MNLLHSNIIKEIWNRRSLIFLLAINDVKLRYKNSVLGFLWTFLEPLLMLSVLYFVFTNIIKSRVENYPLFLLLGLIVWYMFSRATTGGLSSLVDKSGIIQKIYFRRELIVISSCITAFIMMMFEFTAFGVFLVAFKFIPPLTILLLPLLLIILFFMSLGLSFFLASLNVYFRDIKFIWQVILQVGFFVSPIIYNLDMFPENVRRLLEFNPLVPLFDTIHQVVLSGTLPSTNVVLQIIISTTVVFFIGYGIFRIKDKRIVEEL